MVAPAFLAVNDAARDEWSKAASVHDDVGFFGLVYDGRVFTVANMTKVLLLEHKGGWMADTWTQVRIMDGGKFGASGWLRAKFVVRE